jgi:hypothetical protein
MRASAAGGGRGSFPLTDSQNEQLENKCSFEFDASFDVSGNKPPVAVVLTIGDDRRSATVKPELR